MRGGAVRGAKYRQHVYAHVKHGYEVGVIAVAQRSISTGRVQQDMSRPVYLKPVASNRGIAWFCRGPLAPLRVRIDIRQSVRVFEDYRSVHGPVDIIHAHGSHMAGLVARRIQQTHEVPYVITENLSNVFRDRVPASVGERAELALMDAKHRIMLSPDAGQDLVSVLGKRADPWSYIPNLVSDIFHPAKPESDKHSGEELRVVAIGRLVGGKGFEDLITAFDMALRSISAKLRIIGEGPRRPRLQELIESLGLRDNVTIIGQVGRKDVARELRLADVYVSASHYETFGLPVAEALASGVPVVATSTGIAPTVITEKLGRVVDIGSPGLLAEALVSVGTHLGDFDPHHLHSVARAQFGLDEVMGRWGRVYAEVLDLDSDPESDA